MISPSIPFLSSIQQYSYQTYSLDDIIISNPERGFYHYTSSGSSGGYNLLSTSTLTGYRTNENITVIQRQFFLIDFISGIPISASYLTNMQTDFDRIRIAGIKVLIRFTYTSNTASEYQPTKAQILAHIAQLAAVVNANKDVIVSIQAGFIGRYGEWYYTGSSEFGDSTSIGNDSTQINNRKEVLDYIIAQFDADILLQVRTVSIKQTLATGNPRIGFYNDAFLNSYGDAGTFTVSGAAGTPNSTEIGIFQTSSLSAPISGETNGLNSAAPSRTDGANAKVELDYYNWSLISKDYFPTIISNWTTSGDIDIINKNIGYRFQLNSSKFSRNGNSLNIIINITNIGYANLFRTRDAYIIFKNIISGITYQYQITTNINTWNSNVIISQIFNISSLPSGTYNSYMWLPDPNPSISSNPLYAIRLSNTGTWDFGTGYNNLNQTFAK